MLKNWEHVKKTPLQPFSYRENGTLQICVYGCGSHSNLRGNDFTLTLSHGDIYLFIYLLADIEMQRQTVSVGDEFGKIVTGKCKTSAQRVYNINFSNKSF